MGKGGNLNPAIGQPIGDIMGRGLAIDRGIEGKDYLLQIGALRPGDQSRDRQVIRPNPIEADKVPPKT